MKKKGAVVFFVKTPLVSAVKTRLAQGIGRENADQFYALALRATEELGVQLRQQMPVDVYWAVAEDACLQLPLWQSFPRISQGDGGLGQRLDKVYQSFIQKYSFVSLMGADSPHVLLEDLKVIVSQSMNAALGEFVMGETLDGGFYYFSGNILVPSQIWHQTEYSTSNTALDLRNRLGPLGKVLLGKQQFDIDLKEDLLKMAALSLVQEWLPAQRDLLLWVQKTILSKE